MKRDMIRDVLFLCAFCAILLGFSLSSLSGLKKVASGKEFSVGGWKETSSALESEWKEQIAGRNELIDLYGIVQRILNRDMIGNFEFVKDDIGILQRYEAAPPQTKPFEESILNLQKKLEQTDTPLVYLQIPDKTKELPVTQQIYFSGQRVELMLNRLSDGGVDILDMEPMLTEDPQAPTRSEFFFHTDVHFSTQAEFWMARHLVRHLSEQYGVSFPNADQVFDLSQYEITKYDFLGNTARSAGRYFAGTDCFELFIPTFNTDMALINKNGEQIRNGTFQLVVMNGYEKRNNNNLYSYWITNYAQYPQPYYQYQNHLVEDGPSLLIISDSGFMRGISVLSLACKSVTVVDPRFMGGTEYVEQALNAGEYDAVIVFAISSSMLQRRFSVETKILDLPQKSGQTADYWIANQGLCLDSCNDARVGNAARFQIEKDANQVKIVGWAADFDALKPLSALYLQVGDCVIRCNYGIERTSVSNHFNNLDLKNTGFNVTFPVSYLQEGTNTLQFVQISADGSSRYEPVSYELSY